MTTGQRAARFSVEGWVHYRFMPDATWLKGAMVNISQSGVLFAAEQQIIPGADLELKLELASPLHATAHVVRALPSDHGWLIGARFEELRFFGSGLMPSLS